MYIVGEELSCGFLPNELIMLVNISKLYTMFESSVADETSWSGPTLIFRYMMNSI